MAILTRDFQNPFQLTDYTEEINLIPQTYGLINDMGLFRGESITQDNVTVESFDQTLALIGDSFRGARSLVNKDDTRRAFSFAVPYFAVEDYISPKDVAGKRAYGSPDQAETEDQVMARKLARIQRNVMITVEAARMHAIVEGKTYAPNGTVVADFYSSFGVARPQIDFDMDQTTTEVLNKIEPVIAYIQDNIQSGEMVTGIEVLCSPEFFQALITHPSVQEAFKFYSSTQEPLRNRVGGAGLYRRFSYGGLDFVEYRAQYNGVRLIPAGTAFAVPKGTEDTFVTFMSPGNKFSNVNTLGEMMYAYTYRDQMDEKIILQAEFSHLHLVRRPQAVVRLFSGAATALTGNVVNL